jgi:hypothetical protein
MGSLQGDFAWRAEGNLLLREQNAERFNSSTANLLLDGSYTWSVVGEKEAAVAIIDTNGRPLDRRLVAADFGALQLTFGRRMSLPWLVGMDPSGVPVCWKGLAGLAWDLPARGCPAEPPIPVSRRAETGCWSAAFFAAAARALAQDRESLSWVVLSAYLDSLDEHLDGAYLKLQVALEAVCHEVPRPASPLLVADARAWLAWVTAHEEEIVAHAPTSEAGRRLLGKAQSAMNPPSGDTVEDALDALGLSLPTEIKTEIGQRNRSVHTFLMNRRGVDRELLHDWERMRKLRTALLAVYAKIIGYKGPLNSWEQDSWGHPIIAPWWPQTESEPHRCFAYGRTKFEGLGQ